MTEKVPLIIIMVVMITIMVILMVMMTKNIQLSLVLTKNVPILRNICLVKKDQKDLGKGKPPPPFLGNARKKMC